MLKVFSKIYLYTFSLDFGVEYNKQWIDSKIRTQIHSQKLVVNKVFEGVGSVALGEGEGEKSK